MPETSSTMIARPSEVLEEAEFPLNKHGFKAGDRFKTGFTIGNIPKGTIFEIAWNSDTKKVVIVGWGVSMHLPFFENLFASEKISSTQISLDTVPKFRLKLQQWVQLYKYRAANVLSELWRNR